MTNITRGSSAIHLAGGIETVPEQANTGSEPAKLSFLARTRRGFNEHFRYVFSSKAEQTLQWSAGASSTANADSNGANGDTTSANANQAYTWTGGPLKYADKNKATGNSPHGEKRAESGKGMNRQVGNVFNQPSAKTRLATRLKKLSRSAAKSIARNFPGRGRAEATSKPAPGITNTNGGRTESSGGPNGKHPGSADFLPTRDVKDFAARLRELFPGLKFEPTNWTAVGADKTSLPEKIDPHNASVDGPFRPGALQMQHERDLAELSVRLDKFKGLMPGCGYLYALKISEALAEGCHGDARLAIHVLDEMERIRVSSRADSATQHDPLKAALGCMSRLGPWLEHTKPKLFVSRETKDQSGYCQPKKIFRDVECDQAFSRTAALLSDTHYTHHGFDAFCLATGMMSPHALRVARKKEDACGSAGPHQLDLTQPDIGKRLVLTCLQALQQDDGKASGNQLATRVIGHTRKIAEMLKNKQLMKDLPKTPEHAAVLAPNFKDINDPSRIEHLRQRQKLEKEALKQRIDMLIYGNEKIGMTGIGESAFVDLQCWFNDMHTEEEVDRLGRMLKEFAVDYQVCEALAERPVLAKFGPLQQLVEGSSPLYARYKVGGGAISKRHPDEDHKEAIDTVKQILDEMLGDITRTTQCANAHNAAIAAETGGVYTEQQDPGKTDPRLLALQVGHLLLAAGCELDSKAPEQKKRDEITKALAKLTNHLGGATEEAVQEAISAYCAIFAPELEGNGQPANFVDLFLRQNLCNTKPSHGRREQLVRHLATLVDYPGVSPNTLAGLCGKLEKLAILNDGNLARGPAVMENVCKHRQLRHVLAQDNTETNVHGFNGTITVGADIPLTPDGQLKFSPSIQISRGGNKTMLTANENNVTQMVIGKEVSLSGKFTVGLGYTEKFGLGAADCEATAGGEASAAAERSMLVGGQISIKRHALNLVEDGKIIETELARANYEGVGEFGEFRVIGTRIEKLHKRMACNPDNLPQEQLPLLYPEHLRPNVKLSKEDQEVRLFSGKIYTDEERKALRDPMRQSKLNGMSGDTYFRQFFIEFRHDAHLIAVSECHREIVSLKATSSVGAKGKASVAGVGKAEARADLISHTYAQEVNNRRDVKGSLLFQYIMLNTTRATTMGASAELTTGKGVVSDDENMAGRLAYKRRLGWTLERSLIKWISNEGETDDFYSYEGRNYSSYAALKQDVMRDRRGWGILLREAPLPRPENTTDDEFIELQKLADESNLEAKLASLEAIEGHQNMQYLIRFRMRKSTAVKLDQLRCEIHHTEATLCETADRLSRLKPGSPLQSELKAKLSRLEHTLDKLYTEKNDLLTDPQSWSPFGLGAGELISRAHSDAIPVKIATGPVTASAELADVKKLTDYRELAWLKENAKASEHSQRLGWDLDLAEMEKNYLANLRTESAPEVLANNLGGAIHAGLPAEDLAQLGDHINEVLRGLDSSEDISASTTENTDPATTTQVTGEASTEEASVSEKTDGITATGETEEASATEPTIESSATRSPRLTTAEEIALAEAPAALCRHLLTLERAELVEGLIGDRIVSLQTVLEQAVKSKRINLVEWMLDIHKDEILDADTDNSNSPWNLRTALEKMQQSDRHDLLYGLMVRDWEQDRTHRQQDPGAYQGRIGNQDEYSGSYAASGWQGRTEAAWRRTRNALEQAQPPQPAQQPAAADEGAVESTASTASSSPSSDTHGTQTRERSERGLLVDWLVRHDHIRRDDILELMQYRTNARTIDFAITHAHGQAVLERGQYSIGTVIDILKYSYLAESHWLQPQHQQVLQQQALVHPDVDVAVQLGRELAHRHHVSVSTLLISAVQTRNTVRVKALEEGKYLESQWGIDVLRQKLSTSDLEYLLDTLKNEHVISMIGAMYWKEAHSTKGVFMAALGERNMPVVRKLIDMGLITRKTLAKMQARGKFTADDVRHLLDLYDDRRYLTMARTLYALRSTEELLRQALKAGDTRTVQKLMGASSRNVERVLRQALSKDEIGHLLDNVQGTPYLALVTGLYGSVPAFLQMIVREGNAAHVHKLVETGVDLNAAISELQQTGPFGRRYLARLAELLGKKRQDILSTPHLATLLGYALDADAPADLLGSIAGAVCERLRPKPPVPPERPKEPLDLIAVLSHTRPNAHTLHRLLRVLERHGQLDHTTRDALLRFCSESASPSAVPLFQALHAYRFRSGHPLQISTAQIAAVLEHALDDHAPEGLLDAVGEAVCAHLQAEQPDNRVDIMALLNRVHPRLDRLNQLLAMLDRHDRLDAAMLGHCLTYIGDRADQDAPYRALYGYLALHGYRDGEHRQPLDARALNHAVQEAALQL